MKFISIHTNCKPQEQTEIIITLTEVQIYGSPFRSNSDRLPLVPKVQFIIIVYYKKH